MTINISRMLEFDEGKRLTVYRCTAGYLTVSIGVNIEANPCEHILRRQLKLGSKITEEECTSMFNYCLDKTLKQIKEKIYFFNDLDQEKQAAIINLTYQLGIFGLLKFKNFLKCMEKKDWQGAVIELKDSKYAKQTPKRCLRVCGLIEGKVSKYYL